MVASSPWRSSLDLAAWLRTDLWKTFSNDAQGVYWDGIPISPIRYPLNIQTSQCIRWNMVFDVISRPWSTSVPRTTACFPVSNDMRWKVVKERLILLEGWPLHALKIAQTWPMTFCNPLPYHLDSKLQNTLQESTRTDYSHCLSISFLTQSQHEASNEEISPFHRFTHKLDLDMFGLTQAACEAYRKGNAGARTAATSPPLNASGPFHDPLIGRARPHTVQTGHLAGRHSCWKWRVTR